MAYEPHEHFVVLFCFPHRVQNMFTLCAYIKYTMFTNGDTFKHNMGRSWTTSIHDGYRDTHCIFYNWINCDVSQHCKIGSKYRCTGNILPHSANPYANTVDMSTYLNMCIFNNEPARSYCDRHASRSQRRLRNAFFKKFGHFKKTRLCPSTPPTHLFAWICSRGRYWWMFNMPRRIQAWWNIYTSPL